VTLLASTSLGQSEADRTQARELGRKGADALDEKNFDAALDLFQRANALYHAPTLTLGLARALAGTGKIVAALEVYERLAREGAGPSPSAVSLRAVADGEREARPLQARIAHALFKVAPVGASVVVDGKPVPRAGLEAERPIDPGHHEAEATSPGYLRRQVSFDVPEGGHTTVTLVLDAAPAPLVAVAPPPPDLAVPAPRAPSAQRTIGAALLGVGAAGLVAGAVAGGVAVAENGALAGACGKDHVCPPGESGTLSAYRAAGTASTVALVAGGALAGVGLVVFLTAPHRAGPSLQARLSLQGTALQGSF
jgi:hypothetical protein